MATSLNTTYMFKGTKQKKDTNLFKKIIEISVDSSLKQVDIDTSKSNSFIRKFSGFKRRHLFKKDSFSNKTVSENVQNAIPFANAREVFDHLSNLIEGVSVKKTLNHQFLSEEFEKEATSSFAYSFMSFATIGFFRRNNQFNYINSKKVLPSKILNKNTS